MLDCTMWPGFQLHHSGSEAEGQPAVDLHALIAEGYKDRRHTQTKNCLLL